MLKYIEDDYKHLDCPNLHTGHVVTREGHNVKVFYSAYSFRSYYINQRLRNEIDPFTLCIQCGVTMKTLMESYMVKETWKFRAQMVKHLNKGRDVMATSDDRSELQDHIQFFSD